MTADRQEPPLLTKIRISVCVDDYGLHEGINQAALNLACLGRISAISCLVDGPAWHSGSNALKESAAKMEIGLHLNFTENFGKNLIIHPLSKLICLAYANRLDYVALTQDIQRQIDSFELVMGRMPDFIDGHQHVHQLPRIREALLEVLSKHHSSYKPWIRASCPPEIWANSKLTASIKLKSKLIGLLGASALSRLSKRHGYSQNHHLLGVYGFHVSEMGYLQLLQSWFQNAVDGDLLMCHPSLAGPRDDPILKARQNEYRVLSSDAFLALVNSARLKITPLRTWDTQIL
jgi:predicted glycoside hydrolase/deacetylase ChbG (UPF0249 family)